MINTSEHIYSYIYYSLQLGREYFCSKLSEKRIFPGNIQSKMNFYQNKKLKILTVSFFYPICTYINFYIILRHFLIKLLWEDFHCVYKLTHYCLENRVQSGEGKDELRKNTAYVGFTGGIPGAWNQAFQSTLSRTSTYKATQILIQF